MVPEESYERRHQITKMRAAVFLLIFREQVRGPQSRSTEFAVSYDPDSEQVGESKPRTDSGMGTHKNYLRDRSTVTDMPNNTAAYKNPWLGGQWRVLHLACHQAIPATANKRYNTTFLPRNDRPNPSYFSNSTGINPPWNAAHRVEVACIVFHLGLFSDVSCILYPAPAREHVPHVTLHRAQAFLSGKYSPTWQKICCVVHEQESLLCSEYNESVPRPDPLKTTLSNILLARYILILSSNLSTKCRWTSKSPRAKTSYLIAHKCKQILFWVVGTVYELCCRRFGGTYVLNI